jgi:hypothetical protein
MAYETGTATNIGDLFARLNTFASANGWTIDHSASDRLFLTRSTVSVAFRWSTTSPTCAAIYQHTAFVNSATDPGNHTNDSGQGNISGTNATLLTGRHVPFVDSSMRYWFFESDFYIHAVAEAVGTLSFTHFGFGLLDKRGTWTGGEYSYGWRIDPAGGTGDSAVRAVSTHLLDGLAGITSDTVVRPFVGTVHCEGLPNQTASGKWGLTWAGLIANTGTDRAAIARESLQGGFRGGPIARPFGRHGSTIGSGVVPLYPIGVWYDDRTLARWHELGYMLDVRGANMRNYAPADEVTVGSDVWVLFPSRYKTSVSNTGSTRNQGIAYRKVTI